MRKVTPLCVTTLNPNLRKCRMPCGTANRGKTVALQGVCRTPQDAAGRAHAHVCLIADCGFARAAHHATLPLSCRGVPIS